MVPVGVERRTGKRLERLVLDVRAQSQINFGQRWQPRAGRQRDDAGACMQPQAPQAGEAGERGERSPRDLLAVQQFESAE